MYYIVSLLATVYVVVYFLFGFGDSVVVKSGADGNMYKIRGGRWRGEGFLKDSADTLGEINLRVERLISHLTIRYGNDPHMGHCITHLRKRYHHGVLSEAAIDQRYTTFTVDKRDMHVCLRTRDSHARLYDINVLMYVVLHELAHMCNYTTSGEPIHGHGREFIRIFKMLVNESIAIGVYTKMDFDNSPVEYCGMYINSSVV